ncbi:MAG: acetylxylan esterase [Chloroflexi bacterium]|nr:acetylxylan esterase [Chloroflexota bacterium]
MDDRTRFHITPHLRRQMQMHPPRLAFSATTHEAWQAWWQQLRQKLYELLAPWPEPVPLAPQVVSTVDAGDHWREEIILSSHANVEIPCFLLRPKQVNSPSPTILALHGHGHGKSDTVGLTPTMANQDYGLQMVQAGYVVFTFDFFPFGARRETEHNAMGVDYEYPCNSTLIRTLLWGYNLLTLNLFDAFRALDYLETRSEVDAQRIGVMGCSYGGTTSMYTAILDRRIKAVVLSCSLGEYYGHGVELDELCGSQVVPGILQWAEMGDVAGLLAPLPLLSESAHHDNCFPWPYTEPTLERLRQIYRLAGAEDSLITNIYDRDHRYYGQGVIEFWRRYL